MIKINSIPALAALVLGFSSASLAGHPTYVITNDDNYEGNTATVFVPAAGGKLEILKTLKTGGTGLGGGIFEGPGVAIESNASCLFVSDAGSSDIAAFSKASSFALVGNFGSSSLLGDYAGIWLVASADGKYLYAAYSETENIQGWSIGTGANACKLTAVGSPVSGDDLVVGLALTSDGNVLIVPERDNDAVQAFTSTAGVLTPLGTAVDLDSQEACSGGCSPTGIDTTTVSGGKAVVVLGNATFSYSGPYFITLALDETKGLSFVNNQEITNVGSLKNVQSLVFSRDGRTGTGNLYFGMAGFGLDGGIAIATISNGKINPAAVGFYDATRSNGDAYFCSNAAIADPIVGAGGEGAGFWQSDGDGDGHGGNVMWLYRLKGTTITPVAHLTNPNAAQTYVLSVASVRGNPND